ncbi:MAG: MGH1-like glycoside hydrolase domain-containing protein, partial [Ginsengibacter sp.]
MKKIFGFVITNISVVFFLASTSLAQSSQQFILSTAKLKSYVSYFNSIDTEAVKNYVPNKAAFGWLAKNIPLFDCPDTTLEKIYYYRWWSFRKHLEKTPDGYVFTEFITPMKHAGKYNTISSALGHHIYEGRWLHDPEYINDYINFWLHVDKKTPSPHLHNFSSWLQNAVYNRYLVTPDKSFIQNNLPALDSDYHQWEKERQLADGKFWQYDVKDAMEESISGGRHVQNVRPTINSYMYGNAVAMNNMAKLFGNTSLEKKYSDKAASLKSIVQDYLWNDSASFFEVRLQNGKFSDAREEIGFIPWYFNLPDDKAKYAKACDQLIDT